MTPIRSGARTGAAGAGLYIGLVLLVLVIAATVVFVFGGFSRLTANFRGETEVREKTLADGDYRIAAYESFYDQCAAVKAIEVQLDNMRADKSLPKDQRATNVLALQNKRAQLIEEYNADARKTDTRANFLASDLPYELNQNQEHTTC